MPSSIWEKWAQPLGDLIFQRASFSENKQWFCDFETLKFTFCESKLWELTVGPISIVGFFYFVPLPTEPMRWPFFYRTRATRAKLLFLLRGLRGFHPHRACLVFQRRRGHGQHVNPLITMIFVAYSCAWGVSPLAHQDHTHTHIGNSEVLVQQVLCWIPQGSCLYFEGFHPFKLRSWLSRRRKHENMQ